MGGNTEVIVHLYFWQYTLVCAALAEIRDTTAVMFKSVKTHTKKNNPHTVGIKQSMCGLFQAFFGTSRTSEGIQRACLQSGLS